MVGIFSDASAKDPGAAETTERGLLFVEEFDRLALGVAAPIRDYAGLVVGAVVITGPSCRVGLERFAGEMADLLQDAARLISVRLCFHEAEQKLVRGLAGREGELGRPKKSRSRTS